MAKKPKPYTTIPLPMTNVETLQQSVMALKQNVELLTGMQEIKSASPDNVPTRASFVVVQDTQPPADNDGDLWLYPTGSQLFVSLSGKWLLVGNLT
jgi:hypothetical protein